MLIQNKIVIELADEVNLSLLNQEEKKFVEDFVGVFNPGPGFVLDDLMLD